MNQVQARTSEETRRILDAVANWRLFGRLEDDCQNRYMRLCEYAERTLNTPLMLLPARDASDSS